jgi:hypothetical protein
MGLKMRQMIVAVWLTLLAAAGSALAESGELKIVLQAGDETRAFALPLPEGATVSPCGVEAIMNLHCLRAESAREDAVLKELSGAILSHGWVLEGEDRESRPYTLAFRQAKPEGACPHLIILTSAVEVTPSRPPLPAGMVEVTLAKTFDPACAFDGAVR